jgi:branched-chain amino acid transport system permease protein
MSGEVLYGYSLYVISLLTMGGIYAVTAIGLNMHWGLAGILNIGIAGFFAIGAYTSAILAAAPAPSHLGGFELPVILTFPAAMLLSAVVAYAIARICIRLRSDYLAIASIGIAEILRLLVKNVKEVTNGTLGISDLPRPFEWIGGMGGQLAFLGLVLSLMLLVYFLAERARMSSWGRTMRAIRDNEDAARALGKDVDSFRTRAFVTGAAFMGLAGAMTAHYLKFIGPEATEPLHTTFLVWVMLMVGGSGTSRGAVLGAFLMWAVWSTSEILAGFLPAELAARVAFVRIFIVGFVLVAVLQRFERGILGTRPGEH